MTPVTYSLARCRTCPAVGQTQDGQCARCRRYERMEAALRHYAVDPASDEHYRLYCGCLYDGVDRAKVAREALQEVDDA